MKRSDSLLATALHGFLTDYLPQQRAMSPHTLHSYRDSLKLFLQFVADKRKCDPSRLTMAQLNGEQIMAFLQHLETSRRNQVSTRNVRPPDIAPSCGERLLGGDGEAEPEVAAGVVSGFGVQFSTYF